MRTRKMLTPLLGLALVAFAPPTADGHAAPVVGDAVEADAVAIRVVNNNWSDMRVYVVVGGRRVRLGTVSGLATEVLKLRRTIVGPSSAVQFEAVAIGHRTTSHAQEFVVFEGDALEYRIENAIGLSYIRRI